MLQAQPFEEDEPFHLVEDTSLEGTFRVAIITPKPFTPRERTIILHCRDRECAALVDGVRGGTDRKILIDSQLKIFLNGGSLSELATFIWNRLEPARSVELEVAEKVVGHPEQEAWVKGRLFHKPLTEGLEFKLYSLLGGNAQEIPIRVVRTDPSPFSEIAPETAVTFKPLTKDRASVIGVRWKDIGGLDKAVMTIRELIEYPMRYKDLLAEIGIEPPRGILLFGPPGTGKTLIARALANELDAHFFFIQGPEILSAFLGKSEENLRSIFEKAEQEAADGRLAIILIDEIDSIAPKRDSGHGETESRLVATLLTLMEGLKTKKGFVVIGTTNRPNSLDGALRRPGRFEYEIYCGIPEPRGREAILQIHTRKMPLAADVDLSICASRTHGFTGADLGKLCREAGRNTFRRLLASRAGEAMNSIDFVPPAITPEMLDVGEIRVCSEDFDKALSVVTPSGMREVLVEVPKDVKWESIGGLKDVIQIIEENIIRPLRNPEIFQQMGIRPARGLLLHGLPGTGKTLLAKAIANESEANFISVKGPELRSKWFGESEEKVRFIFDTARRNAPCVIFLDEVDSMMPARGKSADSTLTDSIVNQFLAEMDGVQILEGVVIIGATNRADLIDEALMRPGRFDYHIQVPLPDAEARREIFRIHLRTTILGDDVQLEELVEKTAEKSGADISEICRLAGLTSLREVNFEHINPIKQKHLLAALQETDDKRESSGSTRFVKRKLGFNL